MIDALTFAAAALLVAGMAMPRRDPAPRRSFREELAEGWAYMKGAPVVLRLAVMLGGLNALGYAGLAMTPLYAQEVLGLSAAGLGLLMTAAAAGGVTGGLVCPAIVARIGPQRALWTALKPKTSPR